MKQLTSWFTHNIAYKILSLLLAIVTWLYVVEAIRNAQYGETVKDSFRTYYQRGSSLES